MARRLHLSPFAVKHFVGTSSERVRYKISASMARNSRSIRSQSAIQASRDRLPLHAELSAQSDDSSKAKGFTYIVRPCQLVSGRRKG